jgi:hypothetical protein
MLRPFRLAQSQNPKAQHRSQFSDELSEDSYLYIASSSPRLVAVD